MHIMSKNFTKTLVWKHAYDAKLWRHKERTSNTNDHHMPLNDSPPWKFSAYPIAPGGGRRIYLHSAATSLSNCGGPQLHSTAQTSKIQEMWKNPVTRITVYTHFFKNPVISFTCIPFHVSEPIHWNFSVKSRSTTFFKIKARLYSVTKTMTTAKVNGRTNK